MRILQLHNHHASRGGADAVLAHEARFLRAAGHQVDHLTMPAAAELHLSPVRAGAKAVWNADACRLLRERLDRFRPDVVHVHTVYPLLSPAVFRTARRHGVPVVTTLHSYRYSCIAATCFRDGAPCEDCVGTRLKLPGMVHRCYHDSVGASAALTLSLGLHRAMGTFHDCVDRFLALTGFARELLIRDGFPAAKIVVKPNSVDDPGPRHVVPGKPPYVVFAGRLVDVKGVTTMLAAWSTVPTGRLQLRVAGDGPLRHLVEQRAAEDPSVDFLGWVDEDRLYDLMAGAVAVLIPSRWYEGLPVVLLQSLAVGTPVVVSDLENLSADAVADGAGVGFRAGDPSALADALADVVTDPERYHRMGQKARDSYLRRYSVDADLERLEAVYHSVGRD